MQTYRDQFKEAITDDLNMPRAMAVMHELIRESNSRNEFGALEILLDFDRVLGLKLKEAIKSEEDALEPEYAALIAEREKARAEKNWARADEIRKQLAEAGIILEDRSDGTIWRRVD